MALTYQDSDSSSAWTANAVAATIDVAAGDLIVVCVGTQDPAVWCTGVTDDIGNSYTVLTPETVNYATAVMAYVLSSAGADATNEITATFNAGTCRKNIGVSCYEPDSGDTMSLEDSSTNSSAWAGDPWSTGTDAIDIAGTDGVVVAMFQSGTSPTYIEHEIPDGTAATGVLSEPGSGGVSFYHILTDSMSDGEGTVNPQMSGNYAAYCCAFLATAAGPSGTIVPQTTAYTMRRKKEQDGEHIPGMI